MSLKRKGSTSIAGDSPSAKKCRVAAPDDPEEEDAPSSSESDSPKATTNKYPRSDPIFGQKHAFPGLDDDHGDELFYGPPEDGFEYLRMVRSEARSLPSIFIAQERLVSEDQPSEDGYLNERGEGDEKARARGYYSEGVYVALPTAAEVTVPVAPGEQESADPQEIYYNLLHHRFRLLRSTLKCVPPAEAIAALDEQHPITFPDDSKRARLEWRWLLQTVDPQMVQIACMDPESVFRILAIVTRLISDAAKSQDIDRVKRLAAWAWGLLGRCREVGEMGSEEVADIRELGKRAVKILRKIREVEAQGYASEFQAGYDKDGAGGEDERDSVDGQGDQNESRNQEERENGVAVDNRPEEAPQVDSANVGLQCEATLHAPMNDEEELEIAKARLRSRLASPFLEDNTVPPDMQEAGPENGPGGDGNRNEDEEEVSELRRQTRAMLDMIISIVGEFYGQRDLLEFRDLWEEGDEGW
ncbi:hypothetical protein PRK78_006049 [Emydomyces testavorans]|uniref:Uncharacterized protein n=1 Tax=Emydomyces testavorans TaxID=2070801 RepID=A0AAF0DMS7_9EURO|nr:hypothetical protein PRK78_006049 [Emydomyces testavorans]